MSASIVFDWMTLEGQKLAECKHDNPLGVLGPQLVEENWIIRVWMPEALEVSICYKNKVYGTTNPNHKWLFETIIPENPEL